MNAKIKGTKDYFGINGEKINIVFSILEDIAKQYSYGKIITPTLEYTDLFSRVIGSETEVVNKEMYTFLDKKNRSISLRPEGTAATARAAIENKLIDNNNKPSFYYISSMFRYERPQKGRQREFFQFGIENFGNDNEYVDVEVILMAIDILKRLKVKKYELQINSIGDSNSRKEYNKSLRRFVENKIDLFSEYAKEKINSGNLLRIFDSKKESDLKILNNAPKIKDFLSEKSKKRFERIKKILELNNINYIENNSLVRGLDYYNDLVFEFVSTDIEKLGSKSTIIGGGRYDELVNKLDNSKNIPSVGFALGVERLMLASKDYLESLNFGNLDYYIATTNEEYNLLGLSIATNLRNKGNNVLVDYENKKLSKKIELASKSLANNLIIIGEESKDGIISIKDLKSGKQKQINIKEIQ